MTTKNSQSEYVTKSDLKEELQKTSEQIVSQITKEMKGQLTVLKEELEETMKNGFDKVYDHIYAIEATMATKADIRMVLDRTPSLHQFEQLSLEVHQLKEGLK